MAAIVDARGHNQNFAPSPAQALRLRRRAQEIIAALPVRVTGEQRRILELRCGTGKLAHMLATPTHSRVAGADLSERCLAQTRAPHERANLNFIRADTRDFLLPNTPAVLIKPVVAVGDVLDRVPVVNRAAQSLFLVAEKSADPG